MIGNKCSGNRAFSFNSARELEIKVDVAELKASSCIKERDLNARKGNTTLSHAFRVRDARSYV